MPYKERGYELKGAKIRLEEVFTRAQAETVRQFAELLELYVAQHDVTLLVARKAVCLTRALQKNGYLPKELPGFTTSSREVSFPNLCDANGDRMLSGRIALIDEVGVTLKTARDIRDRLISIDASLEPDILLGAVSADCRRVEEMLGEKVCVVERMGETEVLEFARAISLYVQLSGLTSNSDQPIFSAALDSEVLGSALGSIIATDVTSAGQRERGLRSLTITYDARTWLRRVGLEPEKSLVKARVYAEAFGDGQSRVSVVPFVIPGPMSDKAIHEAFRSICTESLWSEVPEGARSETEARLRIVLFSLACDLGRHVMRKIGRTCDFDCPNEPERMCFRRLDLGRLIPMEPGDGELVSMSAVDRTQLELAVGSIRMSALNGEKHHGGVHLSAAEISAAAGYACDAGDCVGAIASTALDMLVDSGLMVPCPTLGADGAYERRFRSGEVSRLTRGQIVGFGRNLDKLNIGSAEDSGYEEAVNRIGVLFGRYLAAGVNPQDRPTVTDPFVFSYLGESAIVGNTKMESFSLAKTVDFVLANDLEEDGSVDRAARMFMLSLKNLGGLCAEGGNPFSDGNATSALALLDELIEADGRMGFVETRIACATGYQEAKLSGGNMTAETSARIRDRADRLSAAEERAAGRPRLLDASWLDSQDLSESDFLASPQYKRILAPSRDANDAVAASRKMVVNYLNEVASGKAFAAFDGEVAVAKLEALEDGIMRDEKPCVPVADVGSITRLANAAGVKICVREGSHIEGALAQAPVIREGEAGFALYFPQEGVRPTYVSTSLEPTLPRVSGRPSDIELIYPAVVRGAVTDLLTNDVAGNERAAVHLVCAPNWEGLDEACRAVEDELAKPSSKAVFLERKDAREVYFPGLRLPEDKASMVTFTLGEKKSSVVIKANRDAILAEHMKMENTYEH